MWGGVPLHICSVLMLSYIQDELSKIKS